MKGVILAAGDGGRLRPLTLDTPKVLLEVGGRPLIHYSIEAFRSAGVSDIAVVVGYQADKIREALEDAYPDLWFTYNENYQEGNAASVYAARSFVSDEPFALCMGDHTISAEMVQPLMVDDGDDCVLCVDTTAWHPSQLDDATRVMVSPEGYVTAIGKRLRNWNALDTGVFKMAGGVFAAIEQLVETQGLQVGISDAVRFMGSHGQPFATRDVSGVFWADIDTPGDYESVDNLLRERYAERL